MSRVSWMVPFGPDGKSWAMRQFDPDVDAIPKGAIPADEYEPAPVDINDTADPFDFVEEVARRVKDLIDNDTDEDDE